MDAKVERQREKDEISALRAKHARARRALRALAAMPEDERAEFIRARAAEQS